MLMSDLRSLKYRFYTFVNRFDRNMIPTANYIQYSRSSVDIWSPILNMHCTVFSLQVVNYYYINSTFVYKCYFEILQPL